MLLSRPCQDELYGALVSFKERDSCLHAYLQCSASRPARHGPSHPLRPQFYGDYDRILSQTPRPKFFKRSPRTVSTDGL